jgi:hypothetical protein
MKRGARGFLTRSLAAGALVLAYTLGFVGVTSFAGVQSAQARGRGGRGGGGLRGRGFRGRGRGIYFSAPYAYYDDSCYWSPGRGRWVCPYYYSPYRSYW